MTLRVLRPGAFSLVVDRGRRHTRDRGIPSGGAADRTAWMLGNALVGNQPDAAALEITLAGPELYAETDVGVCIAGARFDAFVEGRPVATYTTFTLRRGEILSIRGCNRAMRCYVCVSGGGFDTPSVAGGRTGLSPVEPGMRLACAARPVPARALAPESILDAGDRGEPALLHVVDGPQADWFDRSAFATAPYRVQPASNRMGLRLSGAPLLRPPRELASEAIAPGAVQVANDGQCIVVGVDGQTVGGYPKVAHVIRADLDRLGQLRPGSSVRFEPVSVETAEALGTAHAAVVAKTLARIAAAEWIELPLRGGG